jgi:fibronectin-binding autotransporter adhesin
MTMAVPQHQVPTIRLARRPFLAASTLGITSLLLPSASGAASGDGSRAGVQYLDASGGNVTDVVIGGTAYRVHTFTSSGTFEVSALGVANEVEYLIVGGGGAGGHGRHCGGGGAGGVVHNVGATPLSVTVATFPVTVGAGGARATSFDASVLANDGSPSSVFGLVALGGGAGGMHVSSGVAQGGRGRDGGSGGGSGHGESPAGLGRQPTSDAGGAGSSGSLAINRSANGAGGGAGGPGLAPEGTETDPVGAGGEGGPGLQVDIDGNAHFWGGGGGGAGGRQDGTDAWRGGDGGPGGGGGGAVHTADADGRAGVGGGQAFNPGQDGVRTMELGACHGGNGGANTGGGGGGASGWDFGVNRGNGLGGAGGSGIVIIRYPIGL